MPTTSLKGYTVPTTGSEAGTWGSDLNSNLQGILDLNWAGVVTKTLTNANVTLSSSEAQNGMVSLTGTLTGAVQISSPNNGIYCIENLTSGSFAVTLTNGVGSAITLVQGSRYVVFADSVNGVRFITVSPATKAQQVAGSATLAFVAPAFQQYHPSAAKAWVKAETGGTMDGSYNISSVTKNSTGNITVTMTTAFTDGTWTALATGYFSSIYPIIAVSQSTTAALAVFGTVSTPVDPTFYNFVGFGTQ